LTQIKHLHRREAGFEKGKCATPLIVYGPTYSTYTRTVRLTLEEKGAPYELVDVDIISGKQPDPQHLARNPLGRVPASWAIARASAAGGKRCRPGRAWPRPHPGSAERRRPARPLSSRRAPD
jgi:hypothetical protein